MSLKSMIKNTESKIRDACYRIDDLQHPEEKLRDAQEQYREWQQRRSEQYIEACMELQDLEAKLTMPLEDYTRTYRRGRYEYQHPIAKRVDELRIRTSGDCYQSLYEYNHMIERKDILDNINDYMPAALREKEILESELSVLQETLNKKESKPKRESKARPVHELHCLWSGALQAYQVDSGDVMEVVNNGARGLSVISNQGAVSIKKSVLNDIFNGRKFNTTIHKCGLIFMSKEVDKYNKPCAYLKFNWRDVRHVTEYPEANINVSL